MKAQPQFFSQPVRKTPRARQRPCLDQTRETKKREAIPASHREGTAPRLDGTGRTTDAIEWTPEQMDRIWKNTSG